MQQLGKNLVAIAAVLALVGTALMFSDRFPVLKRFGHLPGDFTYARGNVRFYFPLTTCILLSLVATAIGWFLRRK